MKDILISYFENNNDEIESEIYTLLRNNSSKKELAELVLKHVDTIKGIICCDKGANTYYIELFVKESLEKKHTVLQELESKRDYLKSHLHELKMLELPEQRSREWYQMRENILTASSLADSLGKGHFNTRDDLLIDKTSKVPKPFIVNDIIQWGVKYEPVATEFYEKMNGIRIVEFGLVPHPTFPIFGASPDGICDEDSPKEYIGRMLEIKCPPKRKFTHEVPNHYWMQMQGQLEVCDLEECDFLQVKIEEYFNVNDYESDILIDPETQMIVDGKTGDNLSKGLMIAYSLKKKDTDKFDLLYEYSTWSKPLNELLDWRDKTLLDLEEKYKDNDELDYSIYEVKWWKITRYECTLVRRDKEWWLETVPEIIRFWDEVEHYRKVGNDEIVQKKNSRKRGKRKVKTEKVFTIPTLDDSFQIESDDD